MGSKWKYMGGGLTNKATLLKWPEFDNAYDRKTDIQRTHVPFPTTFP